MCRTQHSPRARAACPHTQLMNEIELRKSWTTWSEETYPGDIDTQQFVTEAALREVGRGSDTSTAAATAQWLLNELRIDTGWVGRRPV
jgi:hypothetical protein